MIGLSRCARLAGLTPDEIFIGVEESDRHRRLLFSYLLNLHHGRRTVRNMIVVDLRGFVDLGAEARAADLLVVLRMFVSDCGDPEKPRAEGPRARSTQASRLRSTRLLAQAGHPRPEYA